MVMLRSSERSLFMRIEGVHEPIENWVYARQSDVYARQSE